MAVLDPLLANVSQCHKGLQCVYPGSCHDYKDINGNNLCDHGEVLAYNIAQGITTEDSFGVLPEGGNQMEMVMDVVKKNQRATALPPQQIPLL